MAERADITPEICCQLLSYAPDTGHLTWLHRDTSLFPNERSSKIWNTKWAGKRAFANVSRRPDGTANRMIGAIFNRPLKAHRVAWAIHYGVWPDRELDHINGDVTDNRITNLRQVDHATNCRNRKRPANNATGHVGIQRARAPGSWSAYIRTNGKNIYLGQFKSLDDAIAARKDGEARYGFHENHGRD